MSDAKPKSAKTGSPSGKKPAGSLRQNVRDLKRQLLLEAACRLFAEHGYADTSVEMVTNELGSTKAVFYYQYPDKQSVLEAIFDHALTGTRTVIEGAIEAGGTPDEIVERLAHAYAAWVIDNQVMVSVIWRESSSLLPATRKAMAQRQRGIHALVAEVIGRGIEAGIFAKEETGTSARALLGMISFVYAWWRDDGRMKRDETAAQLARSALRLLGFQGR